MITTREGVQFVGQRESPTELENLNPPKKGNGQKPAKASPREKGNTY